MRLLIWLLCSFQSSSFAIVNGLFVANHDKPEVVRLIMFEEANKNSDFKYENTKEIGRCTGVAIAHDLVLTAGHCLVQEDNEAVPVLSEQPLHKMGQSLSQRVV